MDARTDLYALGAVGYWLVTGTHVFTGRSVVEVCAQHLHSVPDSPSARRGNPVDGDLENLILACLAKDPARRPSSARVFCEQLRACAVAGEWTLARAGTWWSTHRCQLRSGSKQTSVSMATIEVDASKITRAETRELG